VFGKPNGYQNTGLVRNSNKFCTRLIIAGLLLIVLAAALPARDITITAVDADLELALAGAVVTLPDGKQVTCDRNGRAVVTVPDDREALIRITYPGYEPYRLLLRPGPAAAREVKAAMRMGTMMENRELIIEADKDAGGAATQSGRSVSVAGEALKRTAQIGVLEDVMTSIKLLPGVGYTNMFSGADSNSTAPSIRGGEPGDLTAVYDGFYVVNPFFWGGSVSIFDPRAIDKAQLYHGVFSARFGHTTSGLLEISSRSPSRNSVEYEFGASSSAANLNLSFPLWGKGGIMVMGKVTYYDPVFWLAGWLSNYIKELDPINAMVVPPYIRTAAISGDYTFTNSLKLKLNGFVGGDGIGIEYQNTSDAANTAGSVNSNINRVDFYFKYANTRAFATTDLTWNPIPALALNATIGAGTNTGGLKGNIYYDEYVKYNQDFIDEYYDDLSSLFYNDPNYPGMYHIYQRMTIEANDTTDNVQGRVDFDWDVGRGFIAAFGVQELYTRFYTKQKLGDMMIDIPVDSLEGFMGQDLWLLLPDSLKSTAYISRPINIAIDSDNNALSSAGYAILEWASPQNRVGAELGFRLDHLYFIGKDFTINTYPTVNPRLNVDVNIFKDKWIIDSFSVTAGTGLFTSMTDNISALQSSNGIDSFEMKQNRSWTSLLGFKFEFLDYLAFNVEGYYKYGFDRAYNITRTDRNSGLTAVDYFFDGRSHIAGFDFMLQKVSGRFFEGWLSYSFNWAWYNNPYKISKDGYAVEQNDQWRYPQFHRFHTLNLVLSVRPQTRWGISARFGFASGVPRQQPGEITGYPVLVMPETGPPFLIQKYKRDSEYSDTLRDGYALPLDVKFSWYVFSKKGKGRGEIYLALENCLAFVQSRERNTSFDQYTGEVVDGSQTASYQIPIPIPSFGFTYSY
jgi:hypothetical protein